MVSRESVHPHLQTFFDADSITTSCLFLILIVVLSFLLCNVWCLRKPSECPELQLESVFYDTFLET